MKHVAAIIVGIAFAVAALGSARPAATAVNWHEGPAKVVAVSRPATTDDANWNS